MLLLFILFSFWSCTKDEVQTVTTKNKLVKADEFDVDGAPDESMWTFDIGTGDNGWGNNEMQYYTDRPENVVVENGVLKITAIREPYMGSSYTSARIVTKGLYERAYGRFEARIKLPWGQGLWPAFWLFPTYDLYGNWPKSGEIDVTDLFEPSENPEILTYICRNNKSGYTRCQSASQSR